MQPYTFEELRDDVESVSESLSTGFRALDKIMCIPQEALTLVAARPSHGKTTLLLNLLVNMTRAYPEKSFFYFSLLENKRQIGVKLLTILSEEVLDEESNVRAMERYLRQKRSGNAKIDGARDEFKQFTESKRLWLIDQHLTLEDLLDAISYFAENYNAGAIFIDYLQKIYPRQGGLRSREAELQHSAQRLSEKARFLSVPIILGAQLRWDERKVLRLDNFFEVGEAVQDASLVLGLYNHVMENAQIMGEIVSGRTAGLRLTVLKNKDGMVNQSVQLNLEMPVLKVREQA